MKRRGQLFLIEVIIALSVLVVLISVLFSVQTFTPPPNDSSLRGYGENSIDVLVESGLMYRYLDEANYSYYTLDEPTFDSLNRTKLDVKYTIEASLPAVANFKVYTERYNSTLVNGAPVGWEQIDVVNQDQSLPSGSNIEVVEYYTPGFYGTFAEFTVQIFLWYEVSA